MRLTHGPVRLVVGLLCGLGVPAAAQEEDTILPAEGVSGLDNTQPPSLIPTLVAEGTFVPPRLATLVRGTRGGWYAVFHPEADAAPIPAMGLLPGVVLDRVEALAAQQGDRARLRLSGQVYSYRGRNYLVLATAAPPAGPGASEGPARAEPALDPNDPSVAELIRELETVRDEPRALQAPPAQEAVPLVNSEAAAPGPLPIPDGQFITRRRVRVVRLGGAWAAVFDSDPENAPLDAPLFLAPCQNTERLERWAVASGDGASYEISGRVTAYRGRNWIIPTMFQVVRLGDLGPMQ